VRYVDLSITPVNVPAGRRALLIGRDVTALRAMEIMKDNFLSMVSHELNAPLQAIGGYLHVVLDGMAGDLNTQQRDFLRRVRVSSEHLKVMVQDLLLITRRDAGQFELMRTPTRVAEVFAEVLDEIELIANDAGVDLSILCDPDLPVIPADHTRLVQVVRNLITNAVKFTPEGGKVALRGAYDERSVRITVSDTGIGIPPEHQRRIFDRFYQVYTDGERSRGQGLGLAIVKIIVEGHGGTINVWSAPGQGSAFTVLLPRRVPPSVAAAPEFLRV
jgi:signal transduction histidine kinase